MAGIPADPFDATRVAEIDPSTGEERAAARPDADATVLRALPGTAAQPQKRTARFVPGLGASAAGDATAAWTDRGRSRPRRRPRLSVRSVRTAALAFAAVAALLLALLASPEERRPERLPEGASSAARIEAIEEPAPRAAAFAAEGVGSPVARPVDLVDALSEGRFEEARALCRSLAAADPADEALRATSEILALHAGRSAP